MSRLLCRARARTIPVSWYVLSSSGRSPIHVDQAADDLPAREPAGHADRLAGFMQRSSLSARLGRAMLVVMPRALGQDLPELPLAVDQGRTCIALTVAAGAGACRAG